MYIFWSNLEKKCNRCFLKWYKPECLFNLQYELYCTMFGWQIPVWEVWFLFTFFIVEKILNNCKVSSFLILHSLPFRCYFYCLGGPGQSAEGGGGITESIHFMQNSIFKNKYKSTDYWYENKKFVVPCLLLSCWNCCSEFIQTLFKSYFKVGQTLKTNICS